MLLRRSFDVSMLVSFTVSRLRESTCDAQVVWHRLNSHVTTSGAAQGSSQVAVSQIYGSPQAVPGHYVQNLCKVLFLYLRLAFEAACIHVFKTVGWGLVDTKCLPLFEPDAPISAQI